MNKTLIIFKMKTNKYILKYRFLNKIIIINHPFKKYSKHLKWKKNKNNIKKIKKLNKNIKIG